jgi:acyl carrier protein
MRKDILETIERAVRRGDIRITEDTRIADIVLDSMDVVEIIAALRAKYQVEVVDAGTLGTIETVRDVVDYVIRNRGKASGNALQGF